MGRIMVVDDEPDMRMAVRLILERNGHTVEEVASGEDACQRVQGAPPDLLLMDIRMPGQDGLETLGIIRQSNKTMPVIIMTGYGNPETEKEAFRKGANQYLLKPFRNEQLLTAMAAVGLQDDSIRPGPASPMLPGYRRGHHSTILQHLQTIFRRFWLVMRQARAIFLDRWYNPPILFERDPSFEDRISLRLSLITDPIKVIYHGLFDKEFEFSLEQPLEPEQENPPERREERRYHRYERSRSAYPESVRDVAISPSPAPKPAFVPAPLPPPHLEVEQVQMELSRQIQSVAQSLQAEIGKLAQQMQHQQEPLSVPSEASAHSVHESPQDEFHRLIVDLQSTWTQGLTGLERELSANASILSEWEKTLPELRRVIDSSKAA